MDCTTKRPLRVVYGDVTCGVHGRDFSYIFSYAQGGLESMVRKGMEWLYRCPKPTFWRALTDNDHGNGFALKSGSWMAADAFIKCRDIEVIMDGVTQGQPCAPENNRYGADVYAREVSVIFLYETILEPATQIKVTYSVEGTGALKVEVCYHGAKGAPQLPVFGMRFIMPTLADSYTYEGLSGETYPDRKRGAVEGVFRVEDLSLTPYLVPQDCGMHMDTKWVEVTRSTCQNVNKRNLTPQTIRIQQNGEAFAFSCLPYTALEIENATHQEELPPKRRTVLCIYGAVRGVGGIDSWGSDVEAGYQISGEEDRSYSFVIF